MLEAVKSNSIPVKSHAFFSNKIAESSKDSETIDFSFSQNQNKEIIRRNHQLAAKSIGCKEDNLCFLNQIHSSRVIIVQSCSNVPIEKADGMATNIEGLGLAILTADCAPVLFFDPVAKVIGASHAGWRGTIRGILENTVDAMLKIGSKKENISAAIGPCISKENYEVGADLLTEVIAQNANDTKYFSSKASNKYFFDLSGFICGKLLRYGIHTVSTLNICTYDEKNNFHSYRHALHGNYDSLRRNMSIIKL